MFGGSEGCLFEIRSDIHCDIYVVSLTTGLMLRQVEVLKRDRQTLYITFCCRAWFFVFVFLVLAPCRLTRKDTNVIRKKQRLLIIVDGFDRIPPNEVTPPCRIDDAGHVDPPPLL